MKKLNVVAMVACAGFAGWTAGVSSGCSPAQASTCDCPEPKPTEVTETECSFEKVADMPSVVKSFPGRSAADLARSTAIEELIDTDGNVVKQNGTTSHPLPVYVDAGAIRVWCSPGLGLAKNRVTLVVPPSL